MSYHLNIFYDVNSVSCISQVRDLACSHLLDALKHSKVAMELITDVTDKEAQCFGSLSHIVRTELSLPKEVMHRPPPPLLFRLRCRRAVHQAFMMTKMCVSQLTILLSSLQFKSIVRWMQIPVHQLQLTPHLRQTTVCVSLKRIFMLLIRNTHKCLIQNKLKGSR